MSLLIAHRTANTFSALLCHRTYSVLANFFQPAKRCCTVPFCFRHNRHLFSPLIFFHAIVSTICSCMLNTAAILAGPVLHFSHPLSAFVWFLGILLSIFFWFRLSILFRCRPCCSFVRSIFHVVFQLSTVLFPIDILPIPNSTSTLNSAITASPIIRLCSFNPFICRCSHVTLHSRFCACIYVFKTHQSSSAFFSSHV